jgi:hypothetical protein
MARILVVVAHPDDEALWFAPLLRMAATVLAALPVHAYDEVISRGRERVRAEYPVDTFDFLPLRSAGVYRQSDWRRREPVEHGVMLRSACASDRARAYHDNYALLLQALEPYVCTHDVVFSHNPWGEYGHEEHIQVCHAVMAVAKRHHRSVWAWDGLPVRLLLSDGMRLRSDFYGLRTRHLPRLVLDTDLALFSEIRRLYQSHLAWTGSDTYDPPAPSEYIQLMRDGEVLLTQGPSVRRRKLRIATRAVTLDGPNWIMRRFQRRLGRGPGRW